MTTYNRVAGNLVFQTVGSTDTVTFEGLTANAATVVINGNLSVSGNAALTGNISGDNIFNGTTSIAIPTASGNAVISVGGVSNVAVWSTTGVAITGTESVSGNVTGGNLLTAGLISATGNVSGDNVIAASNIVLSYTSSATSDRVLQFRDANTAVTTVGANVGAIEWFTSDAAPLARVTAAIRAVYADASGNANINITTANTASQTRLHINGITGNVGIANSSPLHALAVGGTVWGSSTVTAVGNVVGGNLTTAGQVSATGNATAGNVLTGGLISATGNITGGNIISLGAVSAGAGGISATGNVTGGNVVSQGVITATGNITSGNVFIGTTASLSANVNAGNAVISSNIRGANLDISGISSGSGIGVENIVWQNTAVTFNSAAQANVGVLGFLALAGYSYKYEAYMPVVPDGSTTTGFSTYFDAGTCFYTVEAQTTQTSGFNTSTSNVSGTAAATQAMTGTTPRTVRITGTIYSAGNANVAIQAQTSASTLNIQSGAFLTYTRIG